MSLLAIDAAFGDSPPRRERHTFKRLLARVEARVGGDTGTQRLSLSSGGFLYPRQGTADRQQASEATEQRSLRVREGQLVINPMWLTGGSIAVSTLDGAVSPDYRVFEASRGIDRQYLHHLLRSQPYRDQYDLFVRANTTFDRRIQQVDLDSMSLWLPSAEEQRRIADFLDDRVARIDNIIAARRQQVTLLQQRLIGDITAKIDASAGTRKPLWLMTERITDGAHVSPETESGIFDFVSTRDVDASGRIDFEGSLKTSSDSYAVLARQRCRPQRGDVLFSKDGTVGRTAKVVEVNRTGLDGDSGYWISTSGWSIRFVA